MFPDEIEDEPMDVVPVEVPDEQMEVDNQDHITLQTPIDQGGKHTNISQVIFSQLTPHPSPPHFLPDYRHKKCLFIKIIVGYEFYV